MHYPGYATRPSLATPLPQRNARVAQHTTLSPKRGETIKPRMMSGDCERRCQISSDSLCGAE